MGMDTYNHISLSLPIRSISVSGYYVSAFIFIRIIDIPVPLGDTAPLPERTIASIDNIAWLVFINAVLRNNAMHILTNAYRSKALKPFFTIKTFTFIKQRF